MLARHAEDLFWVGRYLERAEDTARMLDVTYHGVLEAGSERRPAEVWAELLEVLFLEDEGLGVDDGGELGATLLADRSFPGSIVSVIGRSRENARTTREWLSVEVWEAINELYLRLGRLDLVGAARTQPYDVLRIIRTSCHAVTGSVDASMPRGEGYRYFLMGERLERAMITTRVLAVWHRRLGGFTSHAAFAEWVKLLKSVSAYEAYLREHRASMDGHRVLGFLLQSGDFPRSVLSCVERVEGLLVRLEGDGVGRRSRRRAGVVRSAVEFAEPGRMSADDLGSFLVGVEADLIELASSIEDDYFRPQGSHLMHSYEAF
jgi:uncharacterized alpha-E superfamily protein